jgi:hypothetical protein
MAKKTTSVDDLYAARHFPYGRVRDGSHHRVEHMPKFESSPLRDNHVQDAENAHDNRSRPGGGSLYDNDVSKKSWLQNGDVTTKPGFDKGNAWRMKNKGDDWGSGSDPATIQPPHSGQRQPPGPKQREPWAGQRKPEPNKP